MVRLYTAEQIDEKAKKMCRNIHAVWLYFATFFVIRLQHCTSIGKW